MADGGSLYQEEPSLGLPHLSANNSVWRNNRAVIIFPYALFCLEHKHLLKNAQLELKKSKRKDYYKILGVDKNASEDEIKKAYRKRALMHHPGNGPASP